MAEKEKNIDPYDVINGPQFVDCSNLAAQDATDTDKFFETHREEDNLMTPVDVNVSSSAAQFMCNENKEENENQEHYSKEENKEAQEVLLEDAHIECYKSPLLSSLFSSQPGISKTKNDSSLNSVYGTPLEGSFDVSLQASFYTPTAGSGDEENTNQTMVSLPTKDVELLVEKSGLADLLSATSPLRKSNVGVDQTAQKANDDGTFSGELCTLMAPLKTFAISSSDEEDAPWSRNVAPKVEKEVDLNRCKAVTSTGSDPPSSKRKKKQTACTTTACTRPTGLPQDKPTLTIPKTPAAIKRSQDIQTLVKATSTRSRAYTFSKRSDSKFVPSFGPVLAKKMVPKTTVPRPFNLISGQRLRSVATVLPKDEYTVDFTFIKARQASTTEKIPLLKSRPHVKVTKPMTPHFASDDRIKEREQRLAQTKCAEPTPYRKPKTRPTAAPEPKNVTLPQPFSEAFEARQKELIRRRQEKIKHELQLEEVRRTHGFRAKPGPKLLPVTHPKKKPIEHKPPVKPLVLKSKFVQK